MRVRHGIRANEPEGRERGAKIAENVFCVRVEGARKNERHRGIKKGKSKKKEKKEKKREEWNKNICTRERASSLNAHVYSGIKSSTLCPRGTFPFWVAEYDEPKSALSSPSSDFATRRNRVSRSVFFVSFLLFAFVVSRTSLFASKQSRDTDKRTQTGMNRGEDGVVGGSSLVTFFSECQIAGRKIVREWKGNRKTSNCESVNLSHRCFSVVRNPIFLASSLSSGYQG